MTTPPESPKPEQLLPPLRKGLTFAFGDYDPDGKPQWMIHDPGRNKFFAIGWVEYELLERWHLKKPEAVLEAVNRQTTLHVEQSDLDALLRFLVHNFLIEQNARQIFKQAKEQKLFKDENILHWLISYYLFFRIPLCHPDAFLTRTMRVSTWIFSRFTLYFMIVLAFIALYQINMQWDAFTHTFSTIFTWQGLFFYFIAFTVCKLCHELGHAYMCKSYGVPVPTLGIAFLVFWPVLYTDTTLSWSLKSNKRMWIALAGIWVETYVTIIAALIWCNTSNLTLQSICYLTITVNWIGSLLINASPFMRFDGYYVMADILKMPNLQQRAFELTRWQFRRWLFDWPEPAPENFSPHMQQLLIVYSILTWIYRFLLYVGIAILVYHFFVKLLGILLFAIEVYVFILAPIVSEIRALYHQREHFTANTHTIITCSVSATLLTLFFLPISETVHLPATLSYKHEFILAPHESILATDLPPIGSKIDANQPIARLYSPDIAHYLQQAQLEYKKTLGELRRATTEEYYSNQTNVLLSTISKLEAENRKLLEQQELLILKVSFNSVLIEKASELRKGTVVMKNEWLADVIDPTTIQIEAFVPQVDVARIKQGMKGKFYPTELTESTIPVTVTTIEAANAGKLSCHYSTSLKQNTKQDVVVETPCYNSSELGGKIASYSSDDGDFIPVNSVYRVQLVPDGQAAPTHVERGNVVLKTEATSYADYFFYYVKKIIVEEAGF